MRRKGFSLIELSVVLIIIGLLLAAVMKGKDLIKNAEIKKFYNNFIKQWELAYTTFYDRTGKVLGAPLVISDGSNYFDYLEYVGADVTGGTNNDIVFRDPRRFKMMNTRAVSNSNGWLANQLIAAGIEIPSPVRGYPNIYDLSASELGKTTIIVTFGSDAIANGESLTISKFATSNNGTSGTNDGNIITTSATDENHTGQDDAKGNFMLIINLPFDIAVQIDKIIDGKADGQNGNFVCVKAYQNPLTLTNTGVGTFSNVIDTNYTGLNDSVDCGGPFHWGNGNTGKYVTALYKLGI